MLPRLHIITGPTAVGKTAYALALAQANNAEIVSCDSLLVYRGMDIGTAKPTREECERVPHHCIDVVEPNEPFSVSDYVQAAARAVVGIQQRGKNVVVVGGSGFYLKAFYQAVTDTIPVPFEIVARVREIAAQGIVALQNALVPFAPDRPDFLDWNNPRRVAKALERCLASGRPLAKIYGEFKNARGAFDEFPKHTVLLERDPGILDGRIASRVRAMLDVGLVNEVRGLRDTGKLLPGMPAALSVGYRETLDWLAANGTNTDVLADAITLSTRRLVAKQRKWFRTQLPVDEKILL